MAGSNSYAEYESDDGKTYLVLANEANSKMIVGGGSMRLSRPRSLNVPFMPPHIRPRGFYAIQKGSPAIKKFLIIYRRDFIANFWSLPDDSRYLLRDYSTGSDRPTIAYLPTGYRGESHRDITWYSYTYPDTGLNDGTP